MSAQLSRPGARLAKWLDADGLEIVGGHVIRNGMYAPPRFQMSDHDAPGFGGDKTSRRCHCDKCRASREPPMKARRR